MYGNARYYDLTRKVFNNVALFISNNLFLLRIGHLCSIWLVVTLPVEV
jgi:hypothetical protein